MKQLLIKLIKLYKITPISSHNNCRFYPTCSSYAIEAITHYGAIRGSFLAIKRIVRCRPFGKYGYDPVPIKDKEK